MKKSVVSLLLSGLLTGSLFAQTVTTIDPYEDDFEKVNQYFNSLIKSHLNSSAFKNISYPRTNIQNLKDKIILEFDLAGVEKKNIKLLIDDDKVLTIKGEKKESKEDKSENFVKKEIFYGSFEKSIQLPENIDENRLETKFENGILRVSVPKTEVNKPKAKLIPIK
jgi:HSP20 family protein